MSRIIGQAVVLGVPQFKPAIMESVFPKQETIGLSTLLRCFMTLYAMQSASTGSTTIILTSFAHTSVLDLFNSSQHATADAKPPTPAWTITWVMGSHPTRSSSTSLKIVPYPAIMSLGISS